MSIRRKSVAVFLALIFLLAATEAYGQNPTTGFEASLFGGVQFNSEETLALNDDALVGWRLGYFFHKYFGLETQFSYTRGEGGRPLIKSRLFHQDLNLVARLPLEARSLRVRHWHVYTTIGLGMFYLDPDLRGDRRHFSSLSFNQGVGFKALLNKHWALRGEFRGYLFESPVDVDDPEATPILTAAHLSFALTYMFP